MGLQEQRRRFCKVFHDSRACVKYSVASKSFSVHLTAQQYFLIFFSNTRRNTLPVCSLSKDHRHEYWAKATGPAL